MDVVVPFRGTPAALEELRSALACLELRDGDSLTIVDNDARPRAPVGEVLHAPELQTPGYARNRGAERGSGEWLVFLDADAVPAPDLFDRYFEPSPGERTALLAGGIRDEEVPPGGPAVARYSYLRGGMGQEVMLRYGRWGFPKTANAACRRAAFEEVGGFREDVRAAEDADLTYRLRAAGWEVERREQATAVHRSRRTLGAFVVQRLLWGAGAGWLAREHPGAFRPRRLPGLVWWAFRAGARDLASARRARDRDAAIVALLDPLEQVLYELGRALPNERPVRLPRVGRGRVA